MAGGEYQQLTSSILLYFKVWIAQSSYEKLFDAVGLDYREHATYLECNADNGIPTSGLKGQCHKKNRSHEIMSKLLSIMIYHLCSIVMNYGTYYAVVVI